MSDRMQLDGTTQEQWSPSNTRYENHVCLNDLSETLFLYSNASGPIDKYTLEDLDAVVGDNKITNIAGYVTLRAAFVFPGTNWIGWAFYLGDSVDASKYMSTGGQLYGNIFTPQNTNFSEAVEILPADRANIVAELHAVGGQWNLGGGYLAISQFYLEVTHVPQVFGETKKIEGVSPIRSIIGLSPIEPVESRSPVETISGSSPIEIIEGFSKVSKS